MLEILRDLIEKVKLMAVLAWINGYIPLFRIWIWPISSLVTPLSIVVLLTMFGGEVGLRLSLAGGLIWSIASNGIGLIGDAAFYRLELKFQHMLVASRVTPVVYALGLALSILVYSLPGVILFICLLLYAASVLDPLSLIVALFLLWISTAGLGFTISTLFKDMRYTWAVSNILSFLLGIVPPVYYPATLLPDPFVHVAMMVPTSAAGVLIHHSVGIVEYSSMLLAEAWIALVAHAIVSLILTARVSHWRTR